MSKVITKKRILLVIVVALGLLFFIDLMGPWFDNGYSYSSKAYCSLTGRMYEICTVEDCCNPITSSNYGRYLCRPKVCNISG